MPNAVVHTLPANRLTDDQAAADFGRQLARERLANAIQYLTQVKDDPVTVLNRAIAILQGATP